MRVRRLVLWGGVAVGASELSRRVEDGQFEREYSRLYGAIVLVFALTFAVVVAVGLGNLLTRRARRTT